MSVKPEDVLAYTNTAMLLIGRGYEIMGILQGASVEGRPPNEEDRAAMDQLVDNAKANWEDAISEDEPTVG